MKDTTKSPYKLALTLKEVESIVNAQDGTIPVTNIEYPEIISGKADGIIITKQDLKDALTVLDAAFAQSGFATKNLVTISVGFGPSEAGSYSSGENAPEKRATTPPANGFPGSQYNGNWSGTTNYSYTAYRGPAYSFLGGEAGTPWHIRYVSTGGTDLGTLYAQYASGSGYYVNAISFSTPFYGIMYNDSTQMAAMNAFYQFMI
ncbi:MAG: hypothetical protein LBB94_03250 [Clostridiales bacterium]|jgi:hypothetical protein|nr:hypothetical protein [Clostridiales bacterium]